MTEPTTRTRRRQRTDTHLWLALVFLAFIAFAPQDLVASATVAAVRLACLVGAFWVLTRLFAEQGPR